ncbi:PD-(D/E)XK motif protein [Streptomyces lunaelactis]|uniref:PD-(D/E)XK motif protein n=1 Tax=Streptomyces lunaelactis TaxID=1535768 RepID=UPI0015852583|nr:PD-(D/E)XK motif protein [Streptomyces lunaelactis]NUK56806.1 PD-(D/E)XK motif protein [Streptomyces lunaelactis]
MADGPYVPWRSVEHYLGESQSTSYRLSAPSTHPEVSYVVGDGGREIALYVELERRHQPPRSPLPLIRIDQIAERGMRMARIRTTQTALVRDFHDLLNAVADRIVTHDRTLDQAFGETVRAWSALLDRPRGLGAEKRIGLIGELSAVASIAHAHDWATALESWKGPDGEEHDFGLPGFDMEVKTTASEQPRHTIHGLGQLTPTGDRPLWLLSLQVTRGGTDGRTLADCVQAVRAEVAEQAPASVDRFDRKLAAAGWDPELPDDERWRLRTGPVALLVDDQLPRLDAECVPAQFRDRVRDVTYTLDVSGLAQSSEPPSVLADLRIP